jgi:hypothetical protein
MGFSSEQKGGSQMNFAWEGPLSNPHRNARLHIRKQKKENPLRGT